MVDEISPVLIVCFGFYSVATTSLLKDLQKKNNNIDEILKVY